MTKFENPSQKVMSNIGEESSNVMRNEEKNDQVEQDETVESECPRDDDIFFFICIFLENEDHEG